MIDEGQQECHCPGGSRIQWFLLEEMLRLHLLQKAVLALERSSLTMRFALFRDEHITLRRVKRRDQL
jgi:hypothetical protein